MCCLMIIFCYFLLRLGVKFSWSYYNLHEEEGAAVIGKSQFREVMEDSSGCCSSWLWRSNGGGWAIGVVKKTSAEFLGIYLFCCGGVASN